ncbi:uncharacterized protein BXIN_0354 [Babesia sp. Xinjiang]|uniref:uncharacterized protein n=1 Tax=Babesia sp. Xinjiang TaxID=462227 RepID=UPI000A238874|nr:uncharacterized protein BXIN_0354 [Babesia sp. Xinjiang]ORM41195.1 hypothetical protein BXIN_0354 [Babesia sp. Xinjiang]
MPGVIFEFTRYLTGFMAFLSLILPYYFDFTKLNPFVLRPILNIAWAFIFGSHIWYLIFSSDDLFLPDGDEGYYFGRKKDQPFTEGYEECNKFLTCTLFSNALIVCATRGLAPYYKNVQYCSVASLFATSINVFLVPRATEANTQNFPFNHVAPATCSRALAWFTCVALVIYGFL